MFDLKENMLQFAFPASNKQVKQPKKLRMQTIFDNIVNPVSMQ